MNAVYEQKQELEDVIIQHLPMIKRIVDQINLKHTEYDQEDMIQIGVLGLIEAFKRYDSEKGAPFQHYGGCALCRAGWRV